MQVAQQSKNSLQGVRLDKWLWAARFFKTRSLATQAISGGQVRVEDERVKPARVVRIGETIELVLADGPRTVVVKALSEIRGPAPVARLLYEETAESVAAREKRKEDHHLLVDPAAEISGRPTKVDRRKLERWRG